MRCPNHLMPCTCTGEPLYYSGRLISWEVSRLHTYDYYQEAIAWQEQQKMPHVGLSIDRRTLKHLSRGLCECPPTSLICACCMCQYTMLDGTNGEMGRIGAYTYFSQISAKCFQANYSRFTYCRKRLCREIGKEKYFKLFGNTVTFLLGVCSCPVCSAIVCTLFPEAIQS